MYVSRAFQILVSHLWYLVGVHHTTVHRALNRNEASNREIGHGESEIFDTKRSLLVPLDADIETMYTSS